MLNWDGLNTPYFPRAIHDILFGLGFIILLLPTYLYLLLALQLISGEENFCWHLRS
jgi:hypothetical protein